MRKHIVNNRDFLNDNALVEKLDSMRKHIVNDRDFLSKSELSSCVFSKKIKK